MDRQTAKQDKQTDTSKTINFWSFDVYQHFLLFQHCFQLYSRKIPIIWATRALSAATAFYLDKSKILSSGKELQLTVIHSPDAHRITVVVCKQYTFFHNVSLSCEANSSFITCDYFKLSFDCFKLLSPGAD